MPRLPEIVSRYANSPFAIAGGTTGAESEPVIHEVPQGSVAIVALHAWFLSLYDYQAAGVSFTAAASFLPTLTDLSGGNSRTIEISTTGQPLRFMSKMRPALITVQPAASRLLWRARVDDASLVESAYPDASVFLWLRAVVADASLPVAQLLQLLGPGLA